LVGAAIARDVVLKQLDTIDQLLGEAEPDQAGVVIWDARGESDSSAPLARLRQRLPAMAVMVLDDAAMSAQWKRLVDQRLIASMASLPIAAESFDGALNLAFDEMQMRRGVLGSTVKPAPEEAAPPKGSSMRVVLGGRRRHRRAGRRGRILHVRIQTAQILPRSRRRRSASSSRRNPRRDPDTPRIQRRTGGLAAWKGDAGHARAALHRTSR